MKGASDFLHGAFVTYTKDQKTLAVGVFAGLQKTSGSPSMTPWRVALAEGALERSKADLGIGIIGVLGPFAADEDGNSVGLVYITCAPRDGTTRCERH